MKVLANIFGAPAGLASPEALLVAPVEFEYAELIEIQEALIQRRQFRDLRCQNNAVALSRVNFLVEQLRKLRNMGK